MITWIGLCAGEVWHYLEAHEGHASLDALFSGIDAPRETILMAVGWLAREEHVLMKGENLSACTLTLNSPRTQ